jgi:hypothetical protein
MKKKDLPRFRARRMVWSGGETFHVEIVVLGTESWLKTGSVPRHLRKFLVPGRKHEVVACGNMDSAKKLAQAMQEIYDKKIAQANQESIGKMAGAIGKAAP